MNDTGPTHESSGPQDPADCGTIAPRVHYYGGAHPIYESMFLEPPEGTRVSANRDSSVFEDFSTPPVYQPLRKAGVNIAKMFFRIAGSPRRIPILARCDLVHIDGAVVPITDKPWIVGCVEYVSAFFSFDDSWSSRPSMRNSLVRLLSGPKCKRILTLTEASMNSLRLGLGQRFESIASKTGVLPPAVPTRCLLRNPPKRGNDEPVRVLFVGNHFFDKGGRELFFAFRRLRKRYDAELILVTAVPEHHIDYFDSFVNLIKKEPGVRLYSRVPRQVLWSEYFAKSDIFCMPTYMDNLGYVVLEAMANRLPVVTTDMFAFPEIVKEGQTGLLVHAPIVSFETNRLRTAETVQRYREAVLDDKLFSPVVDALEASLGRLIEDSVLRKRMGEAAFKEVEQGRFSVAQRNRSLHKYYCEALQ